MASQPLPRQVGQARKRRESRLAPADFSPRRLTMTFSAKTLTGPLASQAASSMLGQLVTSFMETTAISP